MKAAIYIYNWNFQAKPSTVIQIYTQFVRRSVRFTGGYLLTNIYATITTRSNCPGERWGHTAGFGAVFIKLCFRRCLSVCPLATLRKNFQTDLHEVFREIRKVVSTDCAVRRCSAGHALAGIVIATTTSLRHRPTTGSHDRHVLA